MSKTTRFRPGCLSESSLAVALRFWLKVWARVFKLEMHPFPWNRLIGAGKQPIGGRVVTPILRAPRLWRSCMTPRRKVTERKSGRQTRKGTLRGWRRKREAETVKYCGRDRPTQERERHKQIEGDRESARREKRLREREERKKTAWKRDKERGEKTRQKLRERNSESEEKKNSERERETYLNKRGKSSD